MLGFRATWFDVVMTEYMNSENSIPQRHMHFHLFLNSVNLGCEGWDEEEPSEDACHQKLNQKIEYPNGGI